MASYFPGVCLPLGQIPSWATALSLASVFPLVSDRLSDFPLLNDPSSKNCHTPFQNRVCLTLDTRTCRMRLTHFDVSVCECALVCLFFPLFKRHTVIAVFEKKKKAKRQQRVHISVHCLGAISLL